VASIIRSCRIDCKWTERQLFQLEALGDGDCVAAGVVEEELTSAGEIVEIEAQGNGDGAAHEAIVCESGV
jgi:hypothetical protein